MPSPATVCRRAALFLLVVCGGLLLALGGGLAWLRTDAGELFLRTRTQPLLNAALAASGLSLELEGLSGPLPQALRLRGLTLRDAHGPWLTVAEAALIPDFAALLQGRIRIREIRIDRPALLRLPDLPSSPQPENPDPLAFTRDLPTWLPVIQLDALRVEDLHLPAALLDPAAPPDRFLRFNALGSLAVPASTALSTTLRVTRMDAPGTDLQLTADLQVPDQRLRLALTLQDGVPASAEASASGLLTTLIPPLRSLTLSLSGDAPVTRWSGDLRLDAGGLGRVSGTLGLTLEPDSRTVALTLAAEPASDLPAPWPTALAGTTLETALTLRSGELRIPALSLRIAGLEAALEATQLAAVEQPGGNVGLSGAASLSLNAPQHLGSLAPPVQAATATLSLSGSLFTPSLKTDLTLTGLRAVPTGIAPTDLTLALTADLAASGQLRCAAQLTSALASLSLDTAAQGEPLAGYARTGTLPAVATFAEQLALLRQLAATLSLQLDVPSPAALPPELASVLGTAPLAATLDTRLEAATLHLAAAVPTLHLPGTPLRDIRLTADVPVPTASDLLPLQVSGSAHTPHGQASLSVTGQVAPDQVQVSALTAQLAGVQLSGQLQALLPSVARAVPALDGRLHLRVTDWALLAPLLPLPLSAAGAEADIVLASGSGQTADLRLDLTEFQLPETGNLRIPAIQFRLSARDLFATPVLEASLAANNGGLSGLQWQTLESRLSARLAARPSLALSLASTGMVPDALGSAPPLQVSLTAALPEGATALACALSAEAAGITPVSGKLTLPVVIRDGVPLPAMDAPLTGSLQWKGPLTPLWRLVPIANCRLRGDGLVDLQLGGTMARPRPSGQILLENVLFQDLALALEFSHMRAEMRFTPEGTSSFRATGDGGRGGSFAFNGNIGTPEAGFPLDVSGTLTSMAPLLRRDLRFAVSGEAAITGTPAAPNVRARLAVDSGELRVDNLSGGGVTTLQVEEGDAPPPPPPAAVGSLDVSVTVPGRFFARGHGLESEWKGQLDITGPLTTPAITGQIASVRGTFTFLGKLFTLAKGQIDFNGAYPPMPTLDIQLAYARQDFTALIEVLGSAANPRLNLTSQPRQPKDEIVAQILFGSPTGGLGRAETLELAATLASLTFFGATGGGFLDITRQTFGLDVLRVGAPRGIGNASSRPSSRIFTPFGNTGLGANGLGQQNGNTNANTDNPENIAVEMGKYLLDNVYVGLEQGMTESSTGVVVTIEVSPNVNLEARSNGKGTEVGASWSWGY